MMTIISSTNRVGSKTKIIATHYHSLLAAKEIDCRFLSLEKLDIFTRNENMKMIEQTLLLPADHFIFVLPEYNGSFPGILKLMMDNTDVRKVWKGKTALLTGVAEGRGGNVRGLDHFTNVLNYLGVTVHPDKLHISTVSKYTQGESISDSFLSSEIERHLNGYLESCALRK